MTRLSCVFVAALLLAGCVVQPPRDLPDLEPANVPPAPVVPDDPLQPETGGSVIQVASEAQFQQLVSSSRILAVVVGTDWCSACQAYKPTVRRVAKESRAVFCEVDGDGLAAVRQKLRVNAYPTTVILHSGSEHRRLVGAQSAESLRAATE